jgi:uncharacterized protein YnzC (UPF0291/DUF896 family)
MCLLCVERINSLAQKVKEGVFFHGESGISYSDVF